MMSLPRASWHLLWATNQRWEVEYLPQQVLRRVPTISTGSLSSDGTLPPQLLRNRTIIVVRSRQGSPRANLLLFRAFRRAGHTVAVVVLGDETMENSCGQTDSRSDLAALYREAPLVIRQYWQRGCDPASKPNVLLVPLGVRSGGTHGHRARAAPARKYHLSFASTHRTWVRDAMVDSLRSGHAAEAADDKMRIFYPGRDPSYTETLLSSQMGLCPPGNSHDTWRHWETMDTGAIPVTSSESLEYYRNYVPAALLDTWVDLGSFEEARGRAPNASDQLHGLLADPRGLHARRAALAREHELYYDQWTGRVASRLQALLG